MRSIAEDPHVTPNYRRAPKAPAEPSKLAKYAPKALLIALIVCLLCLLGYAWARPGKFRCPGRRSR